VGTHGIHLTNVTKSRLLSYLTQAFPAKAQIGSYVCQGDFMFYEIASTKKPYGPVNLLIYHHPKHKDPLYLLSHLDFPGEITQLYKNDSRSRLSAQTKRAEDSTFTDLSWAISKGSQSF